MLQCVCKSGICTCTWLARLVILCLHKSPASHVHMQTPFACVHMATHENQALISEQQFDQYYLNFSFDLKRFAVPVRSLFFKGLLASTDSSLSKVFLVFFYVTTGCFGGLALQVGGKAVKPEGSLFKVFYDHPLSFRGVFIQASNNSEIIYEQFFLCSDTVPAMLHAPPVKPVHFMNDTQSLSNSLDQCSPITKD